MALLPCDRSTEDGLGRVVIGMARQETYTNTKSCAGMAVHLQTELNL